MVVAAGRGTELAGPQPKFEAMSQMVYCIALLIVHTAHGHDCTRRGHALLGNMVHVD